MKKINNSLIPPGEDQYIFGWNDAEILENIKPGLANYFLNLLKNIGDFIDPEYFNGFETYQKSNKNKT